MTTPLDHLVLATPDLAATAASFAAATGVTPAPGGRHVGLGTANQLVGLGAGRYLEIIGPDPDQPASERPRPLRVDNVTDAQLVTWAVRPADLDATVATARRRGHDPGPPRAMSRRSAEGELLQWRLTPAPFGADGGLVPFLIDWGATPHPTTRALPSVELLDLYGTHPDPASVPAALAALDVTLRIEAAARVALHAVLRTPAGDIDPLTNGRGLQRDVPRAAGQVRGQAEAVGRVAGAGDEVGDVLAHQRRELGAVARAGRAHHHAAAAVDEEVLRRRRRVQAGRLGRRRGLEAGQPPPHVVGEVGAGGRVDHARPVGGRRHRPTVVQPDLAVLAAGRRRARRPGDRPRARSRG